MCRDGNIIQVSRVIQGQHSNLPVRGKLGAIDHDLCTRLMCFFCQAVNGIDIAGHIAGSGDGNHGNSPCVACQLFVKIFFIQAAIRGQMDVNHPAHSPPRQIIGMMFHHGYQDDIFIVGKWKSPGKAVNGFRGIFPKNADVIARICANKLQSCQAGLFICMG